MRAAVKSALIYPVSVVSLAFLIVGALLKWVVPIFSNLFIGLGVALPLPTRIVMGLSAFVGQFWWFFIVGVVGLVVGLKQIRKNPKGRYYFDYALLKLPILGTLLRKIAVARFTRTLGTLITSGVPILEGLSITARTSGNAVLEEDNEALKRTGGEGPFKDMTEEQIRAYITTHAGSAPVGALNRKTLVRMAMDARPNKAA